MTTFTVWIHPLEDGGYLADCPELDGCSTVGKTLRQTITTASRKCQAGDMNLFKKLFYKNRHIT
jgi:hypothetical protein